MAVSKRKGTKVEEFQNIRTVPPSMRVVSQEVRGPYVVYRYEDGGMGFVDYRAIFGSSGKSDE